MVRVSFEMNLDNCYTIKEAKASMSKMFEDKDNMIDNFSYKCYTKQDDIKNNIKLHLDEFGLSEDSITDEDIECVEEYMHEFGICMDSAVKLVLSGIEIDEYSKSRGM